MHKPVRKAVFPVAGLGTRFLPATKAMPKEMLPVNDRPLIQHVVEEARQAGIEEFIFITGRNKELLEEHFDIQYELEETLKARGKVTFLEKVQNSNMDAASLFLTRQSKPLGLGHAIWCAHKMIGDEPFAILLPDDIVHHPRGCLAQMVDLYNERGGNILAAKEVPLEETSKYGIMDIAEQDGRVTKVKGLVEKPAPDVAPSRLSIVGRYILQPEIFKHLSSFEKGAGGEIQLTDAMAKLLETQDFYGLNFEGQHFDCGSRLGFVAANLAYGLEDPEISAGVQDVLKTYTEKKTHAA